MYSKQKNLQKSNYNYDNYFLTVSGYVLFSFDDYNKYQAFAAVLFIIRHLYLLGEFKLGRGVLCPFIAHGRHCSSQKTNSSLEHSIYALPFCSSNVKQNRLEGQNFKKRER